MLGDLPNWDLKDLYKSDKDINFNNDKEKANNLAEDFIKRYQNKVKNLTSNELKEAIEDYEKINEKIGKLYSYVSLSFSINTDKPEYGQKYQEIRELASKIYSKLIFFELEIMNISDEKSSLLMSNEDISIWKPWLRRIFQRKPFQLSSDLEQFIAEKSPSGRGAWVRLFDESSSDLRFNIRGDIISETQILNLLSDQDPELRKEAGLEFSKVLDENKRTRSLILNTISRDKFIEDKKRGFKNPISSRNLDNDVEDEVVNALVHTVDKAMPKLTHRYYKWKANEFGKNKLDWWDRNAPLPETSDKSIEWNDAKDIILESFASFHPEISNIAELFFKNGWIDASVREGKASGAFAHPSVPSLHPYILVNYQGKIRDVMTLAHELGHGVHQILAAKNGLLMAETPLTLAETASVFGEMLVFRKLLNESPVEQKKQLLAGKVEDMLNTVVRQIGFHQFEVKFHEARVKSELTPDEISDIWMETQSHAVGPSINLNSDYRVLWGYIPHFVHTPFYVYAYAFGDSLVNALWHSYQVSDKNDFSKKYLQLLSAGGTKSHNELLKPFQLNAYESSFWDRGVSMITGLMDELEELKV